MSQRVEIGYVARSHGVRGELRVITHDPDSTALESVERVYVGGQPFTVASARPTRDATLLSLDEVRDRNRADTLRGQVVEVDRDALELDEEDVLLSDLVGCTVILAATGQPWGRVVAVEMGLQDRLVIHDGAVERLLPLVDELVLDIDLEQGTITVDPPEGLPEEPISEKGS